MRIRNPACSLYLNSMPTISRFFSSSHSSALFSRSGSTLPVFSVAMVCHVGQDVEGPNSFFKPLLYCHSVCWQLRVFQQGQPDVNCIRKMTRVTLQCVQRWTEYLHLIEKMVGLTKETNVVNYLPNVRWNFVHFPFPLLGSPSTNDGSFCMSPDRPLENSSGQCCGSGAFLTPGSVIGFFRIPDLGSRIPNPYFWELRDNFLGKKF